MGSTKGLVIGRLGNRVLPPALMALNSQLAELSPRLFVERSRGMMLPFRVSWAPPAGNDVSPTIKGEDLNK